MEGLSATRIWKNVGLQKPRCDWEAKLYAYRYCCRRKKAGETSNWSTVANEMKSGLFLSQPPTEI